MNRTLADLGRRLSAWQDARSDRADAHGGPSPELLLSKVRRRRRLRVGAIAALAGSVAVFATMARTRDRPVEFRVGEELAAGALGARIEASSELPLRFDDGSELVLHPSATARVLTTTPQGAKVLLERGRIDVHVEHRPTSHWTLEAGPFAVHVVGTTFQAGWDPDRAEAFVEMRDGRVEVTGSCLLQPVVVTAGHVFRSRCEGAAEHSIVAAAPPTSVAPLAPPASAPPSPPSTALDPATDPPSGSASSPPRGTPQAARRGPHSPSTRSDDAQGIDLAEATADALLEFGERERFLGHLASAGRAYATIRARFPDTNASELAAFHLGRLAFDRARSDEAYRWFGVYLDERPDGELAPEAWCRRLELEVRRGNRSKAKETATRYLKSYPHGACAELARNSK